jgi:hypothetical protein
MASRNPRFLLQDYLSDIRAAVPPKTPAERRARAYWAALFFLVLLGFPIAAALSAKVAQGDFLSVFLSAFGVTFLFNIVDWLILDWLIVCTITNRPLFWPRPWRGQPCRGEQPPYGAIRPRRKRSIRDDADPADKSCRDYWILQEPGQIPDVPALFVPKEAAHAFRSAGDAGRS